MYIQQNWHTTIFFYAIWTILLGHSVHMFNSQQLECFNILFPRSLTQFFPLTNLNRKNTHKFNIYRGSYIKWFIKTRCSRVKKRRVDLTKAFESVIHFFYISNRVPFSLVYLRNTFWLTLYYKNHGIYWEGSLNM